jgi:phosphatidate cytidylyltransferase
MGAVVIIVAMGVVALVESGRRPAISALGVAYVGLPAVALLWLRGDEPLGAAAVLFVLVIVWTSDTAAFAAGRSLGGPKLWPRVSPNKTWSGLAGALVGSALAGALFAGVSGLGTPACLAGKGVLLGLVAQLGDLAESSLKRGFGVKDASALIPGHGGFMDRADSMVAATMAAAMFAAAVGVGAPARALLGC